MRQEDDFLRRLYEETLRRHRDEAERSGPEERRKRLREALKEALGTFERNDAYRAATMERVACDGYVRERVELSATPGLTFRAYVLIPDEAERGHPLPGVLALHGHGYGSREIVGLRPDGAPDDGEPGIHGHFAVQLVRRGLVVIAPDVIGFGERRLQADLDERPDAPNSCFRLATELLMLGKTLTGLRVHEARRALDVLASRGEVDPGRVGAVGFSGGALLANAVAALDDRIRALALSGYPNTFRDSILSVRHCLDNYVPGLLAHAELPEWIGLFAPRPLFLEAGERDPIFPIEGFRKAEEALRAVYESAGALDRLAVDRFPGAHEINGRRMYDWLYETLRGGAHMKEGDM
ncbi:dienelactone hydrolase family protein [Paenibacillus sp.]|uniref:dienelactone hydrolase family protein n=1 Tax=Paenibacillus sp. TaxID=58172 RepID=UPI002D49AF22|nr:alpha/beta hydrolase family protein [Paenibacillus sp.]HZG57406.1 alpha/beta hydrolase family protein [Paenibacillus sp.]